MSAPATTQPETPSGSAFRALGLVTIVAVYFLIAVGGVVRATGSGMGCPDWPKCFGRWVPPTTEAELPANYQEIYADHGYGEARFNAAKTWTEYVNRLIGVVIGFLIFAVMIASFRYWRVDRALVWWSVAAFLLVGFQGWLGSVVVSSNLAPWMVTVHMLVALVIVGILISTVVRAGRPSVGAQAAHAPPAGGRIRWLLGSALFLSAVQIGIGTQVREEVDRVALELAERSRWIAELGSLVLVHRSLSLLVIAVNVALVIAVARLPVSGRRSRLLRVGKAMIAVLLAEAAVGALLFYLAVPAPLQPVHLLLAAILAGLQLAMWVLFRPGQGYASPVAAGTTLERSRRLSPG